MLLHAEADSNVATDRTFSFGEVDDAFAERRARRYGELLLPALLLHADGVLRRRRRLARRSPDGPEVIAQRTSTARSRWRRWSPAPWAFPTSRCGCTCPADIGGSFGIKSAVYPYIALMALA